MLTPMSRCNERVFQFVEEVGVDLFAAGNCVFDAVDQARARLLYAAFRRSRRVGSCGTEPNRV